MNVLTEPLQKAVYDQTCATLTFKRDQSTRDWSNNMKASSQEGTTAKPDMISAQTRKADADSCFALFGPRQGTVAWTNWDSVPLHPQYRIYAASHSRKSFKKKLVIGQATQSWQMVKENSDLNRYMLCHQEKLQVDPINKNLRLNKIIEKPCTI